METPGDSGPGSVPGPDDKNKQNITPPTPGSQEDDPQKHGRTRAGRSAFRMIMRRGKSQPAMPSSDIEPTEEAPASTPAEIVDNGFDYFANSPTPKPPEEGSAEVDESGAEEPERAAPEPSRPGPTLNDLEAEDSADEAEGDDDEIVDAEIVDDEPPEESDEEPIDAEIINGETGEDFGEWWNVEPPDNDEEAATRAPRLSFENSASARLDGDIRWDSGNEPKKPSGSEFESLADRLAELSSLDDVAYAKLLGVDPHHPAYAGNPYMRDFGREMDEDKRRGLLAKFRKEKQHVAEHSHGTDPEGYLSGKDLKFFRMLHVLADRTFYRDTDGVVKNWPGATEIYHYDANKHKHEKYYKKPEPLLDAEGNPIVGYRCGFLNVHQFGVPVMYCSDGKLRMIIKDMPHEKSSIRKIIKERRLPEKHGNWKGYCDLTDLALTLRVRDLGEDYAVKNKHQQNHTFRTEIKKDTVSYGGKKAEIDLDIKTYPQLVVKMENELSEATAAGDAARAALARKHLYLLHSVAA